MTAAVGLKVPQQRGGWTPLHCAANAGHTDVAKLLVRYGADILAEDLHRRTPLDEMPELSKVQCELPLHVKDDNATQAARAAMQIVALKESLEQAYSSMVIACMSKDFVKEFGGGKNGGLVKVEMGQGPC